ncbi:MAG: transporter ATP-binding protein [Tardiphaga sp.]|nr:transporter ATP-binding protein [Tardiphaga sp.]
MSEILLSLKNVETRIGPYHILHGVDLDVPKGSATMLLGRNGAGKTTTVRTIMNLWRASAGTIHFDGRDITNLETPDVARLGIGYVPETMGIFADLTIAENMRLAAFSGKIDTQRLERIFTMFPAIKRFWLARARTLSGGQKQMLSIARAIVEPRRLLIIDEPTKGLAPAIVGNMVPIFRDLKQSGVTILMIEQNFAFANAIGDHVAVMDDGKVVHAGAMAELADNEAIQRRLLGLSMASHQ